MKYDEALARFREDRKTDFVQPPSVVILETYNKYKSIPPRAVLLETTQATLLPEDEVAILFQHLHEKAENRHAGAKKAAITRREKKSSKQTCSSKSGAITTEAHSTVDKSSARELCEERGKEDPPGCAEETISWVSCDGCLLWWHGD